ncbi:MAG: stage III sporulation protein AE [Clostridia bacterium]
MEKENFFIIEKIITIIVMVLIVFLSNSSYANDNQTIIEQQEEFKIQDFIKNAEKFTGEFFEDIDINEILNDAIKGEVDNSTLLKKILNILGKEVTTNIKSLVSILAIILIHSILKSISESLENNNISKLIYYVQYILIVTVIMSNFTDIIKLVQDTTGNLIGFMNTLVPLLITLMMYTGSITTSSVVEPIILFMINFIGNIIQNLIIPFVLVLTSLVIISKISDKVHIDKLSKFFKSGIVWFLGIVLTVFVGVVSLEGTLSSSIDGITAKTTKAVVSSAIPVVGKILGDAVDTVLGCGIVLKNAVGLVGVVIVIGICIMPILKLFVLSVSYKLLSTVVQPIADEKIIDLLEQIGDIFKIFLGILCAISFMLIIGTTLVLKISNGTMMYR